uniref:divergent polysaccharide deacetylase family protein n=1 Tax=Ningiella ruwaisensis TaxID=2364274 RepID=UPI0014452357|nr:divergent polysaccharide deacetylase family protein [Ningiella ruwaisensis]
MSQQKAKITLIIDDVGAKPSDRAVFDLPKTITFAILPHTEYSTEFSFLAAEQNREVMLHMPMESLKPKNLGRGPLLSNMYPQELQNALLSALATVPHAVGVNNHMGSKLTQMTLPMESVMAVLANNNMFFIDSKTTRYSKAASIAEENSVKVATRHIFLDHEQDFAFLEKQFNRLLRIARKYGKAVGIAHPYPVTYEFLKQKMQNLPDDIEIVTASEYLNETEKFRLNPHLAANTQADFDLLPSSLTHDKPNIGSTAPNSLVEAMPNPQ